MLLAVILAIIVALLLLLCVQQVGVRLVFGEELRLWLKVGPIMAQLLPAAEKNEKEQEDKERKRQKEKRKKDKERPERHITFEAVRHLVSGILPPVLDALGRVRKALRVRCLTLHITVSDPSPATAAQRYGKLQAVLWPLLSVVENLVTVERRDVQTNLDFSAGESRAEGELFVTLRVYRLLLIALSDGLAIARPVLAFLKETKTEDKKKADTAPPEEKARPAA